jgi:CRP/FNR family cyclic AMP-dependent transcriptional regulator
MTKVSFALGQLSDSDIEWLTKAGHTRSVAAGTTLIYARKPSDSVYIVLSGLLSISVAIRGEHEITRLGYGEIIGEMSFLNQRSSSITVEAQDDSTVFEISKSILAAKLEEDMEFAARFYRVLAISLANRLRNTVVRLSHEKNMKADEEAKIEDSPETKTLKSLHVANFRMDHILKRLMGIKSAMTEDD